MKHLEEIKKDNEFALLESRAPQMFLYLLSWAHNCDTKYRGQSIPAESILRSVEGFLEENGLLTDGESQ